MRKLLRFLRSFQPRYDALVEVVIFRDRLMKNLQIIREHSQGIDIAPVLKSNAYGHGLCEVAEILDDQGVPFLVVDSYHEALVLRNSGIKSKILVIGFTPFDNIKRNRREDVVFTITDLEQLRFLFKNLGTPQTFHLKLDTGLHRQGVLPGDLDDAISILKKTPNIILEGVCSHLADSAHEDDQFNDTQITLWNELQEKIRGEFPELKYYDLPASGGLKHLPKIKSNVARIGKALYGLSDIFPGLEPVLEMRAKLTGVKKIHEGAAVSYGMIFKAEKDMVVGTLPVGYFEGVDRRLSNAGVVKYADKFCKILGRVTMNITVIDLTEIANPKSDDEVVVVSAKRSDPNSAENLARLCQTIALDFVVHIPAHLRRVVK